MRKKLSRISAAIVVILTALLGMFPAHASAIGFESESMPISSGQTIEYKLNTDKPYLKINAYADGDVIIKGMTEMIPKSDGYYPACIDLYMFDENGGDYYYRYACNETTHVAPWDLTLSVKKGVYYIYQSPSTWGRYGYTIAKDDPCWAAKSRLTITYPTPTPSPKINKISTGNRKAWVYWNPMSGATSYRVYVIQNGKERLAGSTTQTKFLVTDMTNGVKANYYVKAVVNGKLTNIKNIAYSTPRNGVKPKVVPSAGKASITWTKYNGATQYKVVAVDQNNKILAERVTKGTAFTWNGLTKGRDYGFYIVPYVGKDYIPFGRSYAEDRANITHFTAK